MSEHDEKSTSNNERETEIIYLELEHDNLEAENENIILEVTDKTFSDETNGGGGGNDGNGLNLQEMNSSEVTEERKQKMLHVTSTTELCEASLDSEGSMDKPDNIGVKKIDQSVQQDGDIGPMLDDIPNELLIYTCQPIDDNPINHYPCKVCGIVVGCVFCLKSHYESLHLNLGLIQYKCDHTTYLKNYTEICHKCNLVCESKQEMLDHRKVHFVTCDICEMTFDSALYLSNHCRTSHDKFEVIISCDLCDQWFKHLTLLSNHYESYHEMILCIVCFKRFSSHMELENHHNSHSIVLGNTEKILPYACSKCNEAFAEIFQLSSHLTRTHSNCQRKYKFRSSYVKLQQVEAICDTGCERAQEQYLAECRKKKRARKAKH